MRYLIAILIALLVLPLPLSHAVGERAPKVAIISNEADMPTAQFIGEILTNSSVDYEIMGPGDFKEALKNYEVILILGGPEAYEGVGNISSNYIPPQNATTLIREPRTFLVSIFKGGRDIVVLAGHTRRETLEASAFFFKDWALLGVTRLWMKAGYEIALSNSSFAIYYVERYNYNKEEKIYQPIPWGTDEWRVLGQVEVNGTTLYNVTRTRTYMYLGVNYTTVEVNLLDQLGRPRFCRMVQFIDDKVNASIEKCPEPGKANPKEPLVFVAFKMESVGNRTTWRIGGRDIPRSITHPVGKRYVKGTLVLKYALKYPDWKTAVSGFTVEYVNPVIPFGGMVVSVDNEIVDGEPITREVEKLYAFRP